MNRCYTASKPKTTDLEMISSNGSSIGSSDLESASQIERGTEFNTDEEEKKEVDTPVYYPLQKSTNRAD